MSLLSIKNKIGIPSDWKMVPIGKVLISSQYGTSNGNSETGVPVVGMKNLQDGKVGFNDLPFVSVSNEEKESLLLHDGDILLNRTNSYDLVGKIGFVDKAVEAVFASYLVRLQVDRAKSDPKFVALWLTSFWADQMIKKIATRAVSQANVNPTEFKKFCLVPVLPKPEQKAIAALLSTWDEAIEKTERLIQAKEKRFKWLLRELISEQQNTQKDAKWRKVKLGEIGKISSAGVDKKINHNEISVRLLNYLDVYQRDFVYSRELTHEVTAPKTKATKCDIRKGDVFFTPSSEVRDDVAHSAVAMEDIPNGVYSYHIVRLRLHENIDLLYRAYAFKSSGFYKQAYKYCDGSGQRYVISQSNFRKIEILLPPLETQRKIAETLYSARREIDLLKQLADKYKTQKRGLMQKMLTGQWRVKPEIVNQYMEA